MAYTFDASTKIISLSSGTTTLDIVDLYSRWKEWVQTSDNSKYLPVFSVVGGDDISAVDGTKIPCYLFLLNSWKIRPQEASHTLNVTNGILLVSGGGDPFTNTTGSYVVRINYKNPVQAITVSTGAVSPTDLSEAVMNEAIESGLDLRSSLRLMSAALAGKLSGASGTTVTIRNAVADSKNRIVATVDANGNRTALTYDVSD